MKRKTGALPKQAWIAIALLAAAAFAALYFFFVDRPVRTGIQRADGERVQLEKSLEVLKARAENVSGISDEVNSLTASGQMSWMPSYNSGEEELEMLHTLLDSRTSDYQVSLSDVTRSGNQIRRGLSLSFTAGSYETAKYIIYCLTHGQYRCLVFSETISGITDETPGIDVSLSAMFYETMVGGTPDMGLSDQSPAEDPMDVGILIPSDLADATWNVAGHLTQGPDYSEVGDVLGN